MDIAYHLTQSKTNYQPENNKAHESHLKSNEEHQTSLSCSYANRVLSISDNQISLEAPIHYKKDHKTTNLRIYQTPQYKILFKISCFFF